MDHDVWSCGKCDGAADVALHSPHCPRRKQEQDVRVVGGPPAAASPSAPRRRCLPAPARLILPTVWLPADLIGPVDVELAKPTETIPGPSALPGGARYEPKWDGYLH
jgi:hypothetical protein